MGVTDGRGGESLMGGDGVTDGRGGESLMGGEM